MVYNETGGRFSKHLIYLYFEIIPLNPLGSESIAASAGFTLFIHLEKMVQVGSSKCLWFWSIICGFFFFFFPFSISEYNLLVLSAAVVEPVCSQSVTSFPCRAGNTHQAALPWFILSAHQSRFWTSTLTAQRCSPRLCRPCVIYFSGWIFWLHNQVHVEIWHAAKCSKHVWKRSIHWGRV